MIDVTLAHTIRTGDRLARSEPVDLEGLECHSRPALTNQIRRDQTCLFERVKCLLSVADDGCIVAATLKNPASDSLVGLMLAATNIDAPLSLDTFAGLLP